MTYQPDFSATTRRGFVTGLGVAALALAGCTAGDWQPGSPPAAGTMLNLGDVKMRGLLLLADKAGAGLLLGGVSTPTNDRLQGIAVAPINLDDVVGQPHTQLVDVPLTTTALNQLRIPVPQSAGLTPGLTAQVAFSLGQAGQGTINVPILENTHPDFKAIWDEYAAS